MMKLPLIALLGAIASLSVNGEAHADATQLKEIRIATEGGFVPWNYTKPDGTVGGFEVDLAHDLCSRMKVKCTIVAQTFNSLIPALNAGKFDAIIDDLAITPKREKAIDFSIPYATNCDTFATLKGSDVAKAMSEDDTIISLDDKAATDEALARVRAVFKDKSVGTLASGTSVNFVETYLKGVTLMQYETPQSRDLDLSSGRVDAIFSPKLALLATAKKPGNENMTLAGACFTGSILGQGPGVGLRKGDTALKAMFDNAIRAAEADGTIARLSKPVFGMDVTPR